MKRTLSIALLFLVLATSPALGASSFYIEDLTVDDLYGRNISKLYREALLTGVFLSFMASKGLNCPSLSANMMIAGLESARFMNTITGSWTVYNASLYVLVSAGCTAASAKEKPHA